MNLWQAMKVVWKVSVVTISLTSCVIVIFCDHLSNYNDIVKIILEVLSVSVDAPPRPLHYDPTTMGLDSFLWGCYYHLDVKFLITACLNNPEFFVNPLSDIDYQI